MSDVARALAQVLSCSAPDPESKTSSPYLLDMNAQARAGKLNPVVGRDAEILQVLEIVSQQRKANAVLIGPAGAGKTAIAEGLAQLCAHHAALLPERLRGLKVMALDVGALVAGAGVYGEVEQRLACVLAAVRGQPVLLFIDELHTLVGAGGRAGANDVAQWLKPHLARGELRVLAATTAEEYSQIIARDAALERRFCPVYVQAMSDLAALRVCQAHARWMGLSIKPTVLRHVVAQARRLMRHRSMPDAAIDLLERTAAMAELQRLPTTPALVARAASRLLQLPLDVDVRLRRLAKDAAQSNPQLALAASALLAHLGYRVRALQAPLSKSRLASTLAAPSLLQGLACEQAQGAAAALAQALGSEVISLDASLGEREIYGAEPGCVGYGQRRPIHRLLDRPFAVVHLRGWMGGAEDQARLLADLRGGSVTDAEGRCMPLHVAVISGPDAKETRRMGFTA